MPRPEMFTPVEPLNFAVDPKTLSPEFQAGIVLRLDATVGEYPRAPGTWGPNDLGSDGRGLAKHVAEMRRTLGRMPGAHGVDDEGEGIAAHVFEQRREVRRGRRTSTASLISAGVAFLMAVATLLRAEARAADERRGEGDRRDHPASAPASAR